MRSFLHSVALIGLLATTPAIAEEPAGLLEKWQRLRDMDAPSPSFSETYHFLNEHPGWPDEKIIRLRLEAAALASRPDTANMRKYCASPEPISGRGMFACLAAGAGDPPTRKSWLHRGWIQGDFSEAEEKAILSQYGDTLGPADHSARMERLLYEEKTAAAKRTLPLTPAAKRGLFKTRLTLLAGGKEAKHLLKNLSPAEQHDAGITFIRAKEALNAKKLDTLTSLIKNIPASAPYPEEWWPLRHIAIREAIATDRLSTAAALVGKHGDLTGEALAEALWLKGWLALEHSHDAAAAYKHFRELYTQVTTPVSKARAAYWAARAAGKSGNTDIASEWLEKAAQHPTVFYGQLAYSALHPGAPLRLPGQPQPGKAERSSAESQELIAILRHLASTGSAKLFDRFTLHLAGTEENPRRLSYLATLASDLGGVARGVKVAKQALRKQVILIESGWPYLELPKSLTIESALALAITRQESEFDPYARSDADARGLMQLLPSTARHIAKQNDFAFTEDSLENPADNLVLGTAYLGQIIRGFDGSYILGIASYNAGPGSVRRWIAARGTPPKNLNGALNWIESIPFGETRNYVMRVLENIQVYRALENPNTPLAIEKDLTR